MRREIGVRLTVESAHADRDSVVVVVVVEVFLFRTSSCWSYSDQQALQELPFHPIRS